MPDVSVLVLGVGNVLERDDGFGVAAARRLDAVDLPAGGGGVEVLDMGTALIDLPSEVSGCRRVLVLDAVRSGGEPGSVYRLELDDLPVAKTGQPLSLHDLGVRGMLAMARLSGLELGPAVLVGVEAGDVSLGEGLSAPVEAALPRAVEIAIEEIEAALKPSEEVRA